MSDSSQPHGLQSIRLLCPWDFPGKSTGVGCHCLPQNKIRCELKYLLLAATQKVVVPGQSLKGSLLPRTTSLSHGTTACLLDYSAALICSSGSSMSALSLEILVKFYFRPVQALKITCLKIKPGGLLKE